MVGRQMSREGYVAERLLRLEIMGRRAVVVGCLRDRQDGRLALKCGFQNPGQFARDFRLAFGELPSETLRKWMRRRS